MIEFLLTISIPLVIICIIIIYIQNLYEKQPDNIKNKLKKFRNDCLDTLALFVITIGGLIYLVHTSTSKDFFLITINILAFIGSIRLLFIFNEWSDLKK